MRKTVNFTSGICFLLLAIVLLSAGTGNAQQSPTETRIRLARTLENQGQFEQALSIYRQLYNSEPNNNIFISHLKRIYQRLKMYPEWIEMTELQLRRRPTNLSLLGERARALYQWGKEKEAFEAWDNIIKINPGAQAGYRTVANAQQAARLYEDAIETYLKGREALGQNILFANELANLYQFRQDFPSAAREWLNWVSNDSRYAQAAERMINNFPTDSTVVADVTKILEEAVADSSQNVHFRKLLSGYYIRNKEYNKAFESYKLLDTISNSDGQQIMSYAGQIAQIGASDYAILSYQHYLENFPKSPRRPEAQIGLAKAFEESGFNTAYDQADSIEAELRDRHREQSIAEYNRILKEYPASAWALRAHMNKGKILYNYYFDLDGAIKEFTMAAHLSGNSRNRWISLLKIGDCYLAKGNTLEAKKQFSKVQAGGRNFSDLILEAEYKILLSEYYRGNFDTADSLLNKISAAAPKNMDLANDIIRLSMHIEENRTDELEPLQIYALAELMVVQRKLTDAAAYLKQIIDNHNSHPVADDAVYLAGSLYEELQNYTEASTMFAGLIESGASGPKRESSFVKLGEIYENRLGEPQKARELYERFLKEFPDSIHLDEIRIKLRKLQQVERQ